MTMSSVIMIPLFYTVFCEILIIIPGRRGWSAMNPMWSGCISMVFCKISAIIPGWRGWSAIDPMWFGCIWLIFCEILTVIPGRRGWSAIAPTWFRCIPVIPMSIIPTRRHISVEASPVGVPHWRGRWRRGEGWEVIFKITGWWWWVVMEVIWSRGSLVISLHPGT